MQKERRTVSRQDLYALVWERPMWKLAPEFGLSGNGLAKLCRRNNIPVPERGYWAKLEHGKKVKKPPLKPAQQGESEELVIEASGQGRFSVEGEMPEALAALLHAEREATEPIHVPQSPKPHPVVETWIAQNMQRGYARADATEARRRRLATILMREIERCNGSITAVTSDDYYGNSKFIDTSKFTVTLFGASVLISLQERNQMVKPPADPKRPHEWVRTEYVPTGLLRLRFENTTDVPIRRQWNESAEKPLQSQIRDILIALLVATEAVRQFDKRIAEQHQRWEDERKRREAEAERQRQERENQKQLCAEAEAWEQANKIRRYIEAVIERNGDTQRDWANWARGVADAVDPLIAGRVPRSGSTHHK